MLEFTDQQIAVFIQQYAFPFVRIAAMLMVMPVFGARVVPARVRLVSAFLLTLIIVPLLPPIQTTPSLSLQTVLVIFQEILIGVAIGFVLQVAFQVFVLAGQFMAMKMGLGFASMNDPANGVQTTVLSQFFLMLVTLMFVSINGHLILIETLYESFTSFPVSQSSLSAEHAFKIANLGGWMFASALVFSLPVLTSLLVVNIAFGVMSRAAPQLNIFAVGFPFTLVCGMALVWLGLTSFSVHFDAVFDFIFAFVRDILEVR